jgi:hypothetical protein
MADNDAMIRIGADTAGAVANLTKLQDVYSGLAGQIAAGFSIAAITAFTKAAIDSADELNDLSQKLGVSVETLAGFKLVADQSGTTVEAMGQAIKKLSVYMTDHADKLKSAGIEAKTADGALIELADLFAKMPDGVQKTATAVEVFGKAGTDMIPVLNQGGAALQAMIEKGQELNPITTAMAQNADAFNDALGEMKLRASGVAVVMADELLKSLTPMIEEMSKVQVGTDGVARSMGSGMAEAFRTVLVLGSEVAFVFRGIGTEIGGMAAQLAMLASGEFAKAGAIGTMMKADAEKARADQDAHIARLMSAGSTPRESAAGPEADPAASGRAGKLTAGPAKKEKAAKDFKPGQGMAWDNGGEMGQDNADSIVATLQRNAQTEKDTASFKPGQGMAFDNGEMGQDNAASIEGAIDDSAAAEKERTKQEKITEEYNQGMMRRWEAMQLDNLTRDELELQRLEEKLAFVDVLRGNELISEQMHQDAITKIRVDAAMTASTEAQRWASAAAAWENMTATQKTQFGLSETIKLTSGIAKESKSAFELNKKAQMAQAVISTYQSAVNSYASASAIPVIGWILGPLAAAVANAAGMANVKAISSTSFGSSTASATSGGSLPSIGSAMSKADSYQPAYQDPQAPQPVTMGVAEKARTQVNVTLIGSAFDYNTVATQLIPLLNDAAANGAEIRVNQGQ